MIPVSEPRLGERELELVTQAVTSGWVSSAGEFIEAFENQWASYCGREFGVAVSSGTAALEVALRTLDLDSGDEVIIPTFTIISCALAVINAGGTPVLVDSDPKTWCMDASKIAEKVGDRTRAIMPVPTYGHPAPMDPILELADKHSLFVIEDAAEAHGAEYRTTRSGAPEWKRCGSFGDMSCFSFYANKLVTTGEGGMVITDDEQRAHRLRSLRNLCFSGPRRFVHHELGYNYRITNLQAALGVAQIESIDEVVTLKRLMADRYRERLEDLEGIHIPAEADWARNVYWMYGIVLDKGMGFDAGQFAVELKKRDIDSRPFFWCMHEQPVFSQMGLFEHDSHPVAENLARQGLYLPSSPTLTETEIDQVCHAVKDCLK
jgi:perosamine synthetase